MNFSRRELLARSGMGLGSLALAGLFNELGLAAAPDAGELAPADVAASGSSLMPKAPHFTAKAKRVIYMFQAGAPSQLDLFDFKPALVKYDGQPVPAEFVKDQRYAFIEKNAAYYKK